MTSTINLYGRTKITPDKNFKVDDIETYLATISIHTRIANFQYVKHGLKIFIKVNVDQIYLDPTGNHWNYCSIQNTDGRIIYYFIKNRRWKSESTIEFELVCDTINTFYSYLFISDKTKILREHHDRVSITKGTGYMDVKPKIDLYTEGISPTLYGEEIAELDESANLDWYLVYMNQNDPSDSLVNPVDMYLMSDDYINITDSTEYTFTGDILLSTFRNYIDSLNGLSVYMIGANNLALTYLGGDVITSTNKNMVIEFYLVPSLDNPNVYDIMEKITDNTTQTTSYYRFDSSVIDYSTTNLHYAGLSTLQYGTAGQTIPDVMRMYDNTGLISNYPRTIQGLKTLDKTDPKLIKIIKLPYNPFEFTLANGNDEYEENDYLVVDFETFSADMDSDGNRKLKLKELNTKLSRTISFRLVDNPFNILVPTRLSDAPNIETLRSADNEPKLYHSDFYQPKFVYDSFTFVLQMETITKAFASSSNYINVKYDVTKTINSRFMFTFSDYECSPYQLQDYNNVMPIARNNEVAIYNQQYINYLRAGYNYDVKSKQRTEAMTWLTTGLSFVGAVASFASSVFTGGVGIAAGIGLTTTTLASLANSVNTTMNAEQNLQAKQQQLKQQTTSVYGSDDVDLMSEYANNRLKYMVYQVSPRMKTLLTDLFFYTGYLTNILGVPDTTSRIRFNFVACELVLSQSSNIPDEIIYDIKNRFSAGVTFLHHYDGSWDFEQIYENWETAYFN